MTTTCIGIDFGTTNSSLGRAVGGREVELAEFSFLATSTDSFRSLLYLEQAIDGRTKSLKSWAGPVGIERYLAADTKGRLIQSLKSFLTSRQLLSTDVFGRRRTLEELIARILMDLRDAASRQFGVAVTAAVVGRPVRFVGADREEDNQFAEQRLEQAFRLAGFESVSFEFEPVAAAHYYESTLDHDELILIGDFGGGTSDFSLVRVGPGILRRGRRPSDLIGNAGVGIAGDAFDAKIVRHLVSPELGSRSSIKSGHKLLPVPSWVYAKLERWHHLSFLKTRDVLNMLASVQAQALEPERIESLIELVNEDLGYHLHRAVQRVKCQLSAEDDAHFEFSEGGIRLRRSVRRGDFETWIADELEQIADCVDSLLRQAGVNASEVDRVFLTGGTSFVPAVRRIFESRFGAESIRAGNEFTSVARGLALKAAQMDAA